MHPEVLVVDDDEGAAKGYAHLISVRTKLTAKYAATPAEAEKLMRASRFKVVVLDQKMPNVSGTELFVRLKTIYPSFRAIMLTGEADAEETGRAIQLGYNGYLHKGKVSELPGKVLYELLEFHRDAAGKEYAMGETLIASETRTRFFRRYITQVFLVSSALLDDQFVPDDAWETVVQIKAGESLEITDKMVATKKISIEQSTTGKLAASLGSDKLLQILSAKIESYIIDKYTSETSLTNQVESSVKRTFSLPKEPDKPDTIHIVSRSFQRASVYRRVNLVLRITCGECGRNEIASIVVTQSTGEVATRNFDTLPQGEPRYVDTGIHRFGDLKVKS